MARYEIENFTATIIVKDKTNRASKKAPFKIRRRIRRPPWWFFWW